MGVISESAKSKLIQQNKEKYMKEKQENEMMWCHVKLYGVESVCSCMVSLCISIEFRLASLEDVSYCLLVSLHIVRSIFGLDLMYKMHLSLQKLGCIKKKFNITLTMGYFIFRLKEKDTISSKYEKYHEQIVIMHIINSTRSVLKNIWKYQ